MNFFNNIVNELDIALRTLSDKKTGTERCYPPDPAEKEQISLDSIVISPTKKDDVDDRINGKVTFYDDEKGFGFIKNPLNQDSYFFHFSECPDQLTVGDKVEFELIKGEKGMNAVKIIKQ